MGDDPIEYRQIKEIFLDRVDSRGALFESYDFLKFYQSASICLPMSNEIFL